MTVVSTIGAGGVNLDHVTHWKRTTGRDVYRFHFPDGTTVDECISTATADRIAATAIAAPAGYELLRVFDDGDGCWRQPVLMLYIDAVVGLVDAVGIEDHLSDDGTFLITPDGHVFDPAAQMWPSVDAFIADKAGTSS